jgi:hypothetical protein
MFVRNVLCERDAMSAPFDRTRAFDDVVEFRRAGGGEDGDVAVCADCARLC